MYKKQWFPSADLRVWPIFFIKWDLELITCRQRQSQPLSAKRVLYGIALGSVGDCPPAGPMPAYNAYIKQNTTTKGSEVKNLARNLPYIS